MESFSGFKTFWFFNRENPGYVESKENISVRPFSGSFSDKGPIEHRLGVGKMQLKNVSTRFNIYTYREGIFVIIGSIAREEIEILGVER